MLVREMPELLRIALAITFFTSTLRSVYNFNLMSFRWRQEHPRLWLSYFSLNLAFNFLMALGLAVTHLQSQMLSKPIFNFEVNWVFLLPIISHILMVYYRYSENKKISRSFLLIPRIIGMAILLPSLANRLWTTTQFNIIMVLIMISWVGSGYYYLFRTQHYLSTHFTDYTKLRALEWFPHGIVVTNSDREVLSMNRKALQIFSHIDNTNHEQVHHALESYNNIYQKADETYRIHRYTMQEGSHRFFVWDIVDITQLSNLEIDIDKSTTAIRGAWKILRNILNQLKQAVHKEEQIRLQQHLHDVMGESFSVIVYSLQNMEGEVMDERQRSELIHFLDELFLKLDDRASGGSVNSFQAMQASFQRIGLNLSLLGEYPESYHYRHLTYQLLREASSNALKHGGANEVVLRMENHPQTYEFKITNNGTIVSPPNKQGMGLKGMIRLVERAGGQIQIDPLNRYKISVRLPLEKEA